MSTSELYVGTDELLAGKLSPPRLHRGRSPVQGVGTGTTTVGLRVLSGPEELRLESWHGTQIRELRRLQLKEDFVFAAAAVCATAAIGLAFLTAR